MHLHTDVGDNQPKASVAASAVLKWNGEVVLIFNSRSPRAVNPILVGRRLGIQVRAMST